MARGDKQKYTQTCKKCHGNGRVPFEDKELVLHIDATLDDDYPLRILQAYRENCNVRWEVSGNIDSKVYDEMNEHQKQRAEILDKAIVKLEIIEEQQPHYKIYGENPPPPTHRRPDPTPPPPPHPPNESIEGKVLCPHCQSRVCRRKGVYFDHEYRCSNCDWTGEIS